MDRTSHMLSLRLGDSNVNSGNIGSFNTFYTSDEDAQIMHWLSPLEPNKRHQAVRNDRFDGVGDWLLETGEFREWKGSEDGVDKAVLFCSGNPGVGKTYLSSLVIDSLYDRVGEENIAVACLYCDFLSQQEQTATNIMGAVLKQLVGRGGIPDDLREAFQKGQKECGGRGLRLGELMGMLKIAISRLPQVFICFDALDECLPKHLPELFESLGDIVRESPSARIFLTGRPHVAEDVKRYFPKAVVIPISPNRDDIRNYVERRLDRDAEPEAMSNDLREDIVRVILEKISDIFLLVSLKIDSILGEVTIRQRRKKLEEITQGKGLNDAYTATLLRLKAQKGYKSVLGLKVLMWVLYSERSLRADELCHALGVEIGSADLDPENVPALRAVVASCLGLVTVEVSSSTVRLVHFTLQEHLLRDPTLFHSPHSAIAEVCLTYLNFGSVRDLSPTLRSAPSTMPLLQYASIYWGRHTRKGMTENIKILALRLLYRFDEHISAQLLLLHSMYVFMGFWFDAAKGPTGFTGLHGVAFLGVGEIAAAVLDMKEWDANVADCTGNTALTWAARRGHVEVVKMLLEREDVNPNQADTKYCWTPLLWAAERGHSGVVKMLLERKDINPSQADTEYSKTPLSWAAEKGRERVAKMLLEREDLNPNQADTVYGATPLLWAIVKGHSRVVKMLLDREDVNLNQTDTEYGTTPLSCAAEKGNEVVVKMLLEREDVNPNQADTQYGATPLSWAAKKGNEGIVKMLLDREDVNPNRADTESGWTPLSRAAESGHKGVVKMLLEREDLNPNQADTEYGRTPLSWAATRGHEGVVKMLFERKDVNPNQADSKYGATPLLWAAMNGNSRVVKMLLEREDLNPNQADTEYGATALSWAANNGHEGVVRILLERKDIRTATPDNKGQTPLSLALSQGHYGIAKIILEWDNADPDTSDRGGQAHLLPPAGNGDGCVVEMKLHGIDSSPHTPRLAGGHSSPPVGPRAPGTFTTIQLARL